MPNNLFIYHNHILFWTHGDILGKGTHDRINIKRKHRVAGKEKLKKHNLITNLQMCIQTNAFTVNCWVGISRDTSGLKSCTLWKLITRQKKYNAGKETNINFWMMIYSFIFWCTMLKLSYDYVRSISWIWIEFIIDLKTIWIRKLHRWMHSLLIYMYPDQNFIFKQWKLTVT